MTMGELGDLGGGGEGPRRSKSEEKSEKNFNWKWSEKHWELQEIPLKAEERIGNP